MKASATVTRSPTATGLVERMPLRRKLPLILQSISWPSSVRTVYQLPVFLTTKPFKGLYSHDFLMLGCHQVVEFLDELIMEFLQLQLSILLIIL